MREYTEQLFVCHHCDETFAATRTAKYCGPKCRTAAHRAKQKPSLLQAMVDHQHLDLIPQWNATRQLSTYAEKLIVAIYNRAGYEVARMAVVAAYATYENIDVKTEADYQAQEAE